MALGRADEEEGQRPQRAPRPPSLLSFLRGGSTGRRRWRRRERDAGGPSGAEQRMWLMGSDEEEGEEEEDGRSSDGLFHMEVTSQETPRLQIPAAPLEAVVLGEPEGVPPTTGCEEERAAAGTPPDPTEAVGGWSVLLRKRGGGGGEGGGAGGEGGSRGRCRRAAKMVGSGLSGPWAFGVFAVTGQVAGEVSGPCAVASLALAALAAIVAALCHAELEEPAESPRPVASDYITAPPPSSSSSASSHSDDDEVEEERRGATSSATPLPPRRRPPATRRSLLCGWTSVLGHAAAVAAACRALSASMDYITGGRVRRASEERFGALPAVLGPSSPDVLAVGVAALPTVLFVLGLEPWSGLRTMVNVVVATSVLFFVGGGSLEADPGNWVHGFLPTGFSGLVSGSAMSTLGFVGLHAVVAEGRRERALGGAAASDYGRRKPLHRNASNSGAVSAASLASMLIAFTSYFSVATVLTMMVQFRSLSAGTPLVQAFEVRDVDWARLVMASLGIAALALALVEASPALHRATVALSSPDGLLPRRLAKEHPKTATPALAILFSGLLASALAFVGDPLALLRLSSAAPLLAHALSAVDLIHRRYQPARVGEDDRQKEGKTNRRTPPNLPTEDHTRITVTTLKDGLAFLKRDAAGDKVVYESLPTTERHPSGRLHPPGEDAEKEVAVAAAASSSVDEEPLLSSAQDSDPIEAGCMASSSEEGGGDGAEGSGLSGYESDSNTDIDAIVAEYKERLKVATLDGGAGGATGSEAGEERSEPSAATGRRVSMAVSGLLVCSLAVGVAILLLETGTGASAVALATASSFVAFLLLALVARQPQRRREERPGSFRVPLVPWLPGVSLALHVGLLLQVLVTEWIPFALWAIIGCSLYYWKRGRQGRRTSGGQTPGAAGWGPRSSRGRQQHPHRRLREQVRLRPPPKHSVVSSLIPSHRRAPDESIRRLTQVDTILISR